MRDIDIRGALERDLLEMHAYDRHVVIRHEMGLLEGRRRVDVALLNGDMAGWEIKSDVDTLARLGGQIEAYGKVLDYCWLVTTERFASKAASLLPESWGLIIATNASGGVSLLTQRSARRNESIDSMSLAQMLWREEALDELRSRSSATGLSGKARWYVWQRLVEVVPAAELRNVVRTRIKERQEWPGGRLLSPSDGLSRIPATA